MKLKPSRASVQTAPLPVIAISFGKFLSSLGSYTVFAAFGPMSVKPTMAIALPSSVASSVAFVTVNAVVSSFHASPR